MTSRSPPDVLKIGLNDPPPAPPGFRHCVAAIGSFDGVHRGHQALIAAAADTARRLRTEPLALTFEPHPRAVLRPDLPVFRLTPLEARRLVLGAVGIERIVEIDFNRAVAALGPSEFVRAILVDRLAVRAVVVGSDFRFGKGRAGDVAVLGREGRAGGFTVEAIAPVLDPGGAPYSSGRVRAALEAGDIDAANALLGYRWFVQGIVVHGDRRGHTLGYPTANLHLPPGVALRHGVYAVTAAWRAAAPVTGVASFGVRPTFGPGGAVLEAHLFDFSGDLYGKQLTVTFLAWIRPEERFDSAEELVRRIDRDAAEARAIHAAAGSGGPIDAALTVAAKAVAAESPIA